MYNGVYGV